LDEGGALLRRFDADAFDGGAGKAESFGVDGSCADGGAAVGCGDDFGELGGGGGGEFVESVEAVCDGGAGGAESSERFGDEREEGGVVDADELSLSVGGVGERAEEVEEGREAEAFTGPGGVFHGGVMSNGEAEADGGLAEGAGLSLGVGVEVDAELLEDFGGAASGAGAVAVLGDEDGGAELVASLETDAGGDEGGGGGDVEGFGRAAGAAGVDEAVAEGLVDVDGRDEASHDACGAGEFVGCDAA